jgi:hypothetical protein
LSDAGCASVSAEAWHPSAGQEHDDDLFHEIPPSAYDCANGGDCILQSDFWRGTERSAIWSAFEGAIGPRLQVSVRCERFQGET